MHPNPVVLRVTKITFEHFSAKNGPSRIIYMCRSPSITESCNRNINLFLFILMKDISLEPKITNLSGLLPSAPWSAFISYKKTRKRPLHVLSQVSEVVSELIIHTIYQISTMLIKYIVAYLGG